ncbi:MAG: type I restriction enzyme HsdR N-terminal domain-containing protein [Candidatus Shikimatogenerans sp. JK-2022]|nr:type I restriction enzyme HsdR N-terminal domain-containing protein [Candidatus Shikimatogenerans bostrichidophilus]
MNNFRLFIKKKNIKILNKNKIYCLKRKKIFLFSNEEYLRQNLLLYLIKKKGYNISNIYVEKKFNKKKYRIDILIKKKNIPYLIIECKSPKLKIINNYLNQILKYGNILKPKYYYLTNKIDNILFKIKNKKIYFIKNIPINN